MNNKNEYSIRLDEYTQLDANTDYFFMYLVFFVIYVYILTRILT